MANANAWANRSHLTAGSQVTGGPRSNRTMPNSRRGHVLAITPYEEAKTMIRTSTERRRHWTRRLGHSIPGLVIRNWRKEPDYPRLSAVMNASYLADGIQHAFSDVELRNWFSEDPSFSPETDGFVVELRGEILGWTRVLRHQLTAGSIVFRHGEVVDPEWRGLGVGSALMDLAEARAWEMRAALPPEQQAYLELNITQDAKAARERAEARGYRPVRHFYEMIRDLNAQIPEVDLPAGFEIRTVLPDHLRPIWRAMAEAFEDHWGHYEQTEAHFQQFTQDPLQDPSLWQVAWHGEEVAGMVLNFVDPDENERFGRRRGYTEDISVRKPFRRRGLARALLARSLVMFKGMAYTEAGLTVDSQNDAKALDLYEGLGFETIRQTSAYRRQMAEAA